MQEDKDLLTVLRKMAGVNMQDIAKRFSSIFPGNCSSFWEEILIAMDKITEIRIRVGSPVLIYMNQREISIDREGKFIYVAEAGKNFTYKEIQKLVDFWCMDSRYAFKNEIKRGFLTIEGGHRIGICGETVTDENGVIQSIKHISSVNIRVAHEVKGVAENIMKYIYEVNQIVNTLVVSAPGAGKTTLLRDIIRLISKGNGKQLGKSVGVVDERGEIAACFQGIPQLDVGPRTDVLSNCPKKWGMRMLLRSMAPSVIAVDELGEIEEIDLIQQMTGNGCSVIATIHGASIEELKNKKFLDEIWKQQIFTNIIHLFKENNQYHMEIVRGKEQKVCYKC